MIMSNNFVSYETITCPSLATVGSTDLNTRVYNFDKKIFFFYEIYLKRLISLWKFEKSEAIEKALKIIMNTK